MFPTCMDFGVPGTTYHKHAKRKEFLAARFVGRRTLLVDEDAAL